MMRKWFGVAVLVAGLNGGAHAGLAPHEVAVLVNARSPASMEVANHFIHLRHVPPQNVVYLDVPDDALSARAEISASAFTTHIWEPTQAALRERGVDDHILAWIYSVDFPVRVTTRPRTSILGLTFMRNRFPDDPEQVDKGLYASPLFVGPDQPEGPQADGGSFLRFRDHLGDRMPLPAMMLGFVGARGTTVADVLRTLQRGVAADGSAPRGTVYWHRVEDIRSEMRAWQFTRAREELRALQVAGQVIDGMPSRANDIIGLQIGRAEINAAAAGRHLPGSMAEHLTSHAGEFHLAHQAKLTDWIRAGATASAGTVTEPYSIWTKFPHARFFPHYARGHTLLESFYLALRSPTQILLVGEPLARPWGRPQRLTVITLEEEGALQGEAAFLIAPMPPGPLEYRVWIDGRPQADRSPATQFAFDTRGLADGYHVMRVGAYQRGAVVHSGFGELELVVDNHGRSVALTAPEPGQVIDWQATVELAVETGGNPEEITLWHNERALATGEAGTDLLTVAAAALGPGPVQLEARARYEDGMVVRSAPLRLEIERSKPLPAIAELARQDEAGERDALTAGGFAWPGEKSVEDDNKGFRLEPGEGAYQAGLWPVVYDEWQSLSFTCTVPASAPRTTRDERIGVVFAAEGNETFDYFMLHGGLSAWRFGRLDAERNHTAVERGFPFLRAQTYRVDLVFGDGNVTAYVDGERLLSWSRSAVPAGRVGLLAGGQPVVISDVRLAGRRREAHP